MKDYTITVKDLEAIQQYLQGEMSPQQETDFQARLKKNRSLKEEFQWYRQVQGFFAERDYAFVNEKVKSALSNLDLAVDEPQKSTNNPKRPASSSPSLPSIFLKGLIWGTILAVVIGLTIVVSSRQKDKYGIEPYLVPLEKQAFFEEGNFATALDSYEKGNYREAILFFQEYIDDRANRGEMAPTATLYLASSFLLKNKFKAAAREFNKLLGEEEQAITAQAKWHLALIYARQSKIDKATPIMLELKRDSIMIPGLDTLLKRLQNAGKK